MVLGNTKVMIEIVCKSDSLDRNLQDSITELNIISEQMQIVIAENSQVSFDQDEYKKHYAELTARYEKTKAKYDDIAEQIESKARIVQRVHSHFGEAGRLNPRVRCRDLE